MASSAGTRQSNQTSASTATSLGRFMVPASKRSHRQNVPAKMGPDTSVLRPSISVNITGMKQAVKLLESGTPEIRHYLLNECNLIYECKVCFNMFRSLANFIAHKRSFCQSQHKDVRHVYRRDHYESREVPVEDMATAFVQPEPVETIIPDEDWDIANYSPSLELMKDAGLVQEIENRPLVPNLMPKTKPKLDDVVQRLKAQQFHGPERYYFQDKENHIIQLEPLKETNQAMFQTYGDHANARMGQRYNELQRLKKKPCLFVGPDGKEVNPGPLPSNDGLPSIDQRSDFACPLCKKEFEKPNYVYRHLIRHHKKSSEEANNLRKKSKRMAMTTSRFRGLTPEELLKGEDMELCHPLKSGPSHDGPSKSSLSPSSTATVSSSISSYSSSQTSPLLILPSLPSNSSSDPTVLSKCSTSTLPSSSNSGDKTNKMNEAKLKPKTKSKDLGANKTGLLIEDTGSSKRTTRTSLSRLKEATLPKRLRKGPQKLALEGELKRNMKSKVTVNKKTGENKLKRKCDIETGAKQDTSSHVNNKPNRSKSSTRKVVKKDTN